MKYKSWWPLPSVWEDSGLDMGYWSSDCEKFYLQRIGLYTQKYGNAGDEIKTKLRNKRDWKSNIRVSGKIIKIHKNCKKYIKIGHAQLHSENHYACPV